MPPSVNDKGSGFPRKSVALKHVFYLAVALKRKTLKKVKEQMKASVEKGC